MLQEKMISLQLAANSKLTRMEFAQIQREPDTVSAYALMGCCASCYCVSLDLVISLDTKFLVRTVCMATLIASSCSNSL